MLKPKVNTSTFITAAQAAAILSVSVSTMKKFIIQGKLKAIKTPGGHYRIREQDLLENLYDEVQQSDIPAKGKR